jgi:hypothetical protein
MIPIKDRFPIIYHRSFPPRKMWFTKVVKEIPWSKPHIYIYRAVVVGGETHYFIEWWELVH